MAAPTPDLVTYWAPTAGPLTFPPTWVDLSSRFRAGTTSRGRQSELDEFKTGEATVTLDNRDRAFDPANAASPFAGRLTKGRPFKLGTGYLYRQEMGNPTHMLPLGEASGAFIDWRGVADGALVGSDATRNVAGPLPASYGALEINQSGTTTYVGVPHVAGLDASPNVLTVEAWVRMSTASISHGVFSKGYSGGLVVRISPSGAVVVLSGGSTVAATASNPCPSMNGTTWYHVVVTKNGTGAGAWAIYVNGASVGLLSNAAATLANTTQDVLWGVEQGAAGVTNYLRGRIFGCAYYPRVLPLAEVQAHYASRLSPCASVFMGYTDDMPQSFAGWDSTAKVTVHDALDVLAGMGAFDPDPYGQAVAVDAPWGWWRMREPAFSATSRSWLAVDASGNKRHGRYNSPSISLNQVPLVGNSPSVGFPRAAEQGVYAEYANSWSDLPPDPPFTLEWWMQFDEQPVTDPIGHCTVALVEKFASANRYGLEVEFRIASPGTYTPTNTSESRVSVLSIGYTTDPEMGNGGGHTYNSWDIDVGSWVLPLNRAFSGAPKQIFDGKPHHFAVVCGASFPSVHPDVYIDGVLRTYGVTRIQGGLMHNLLGMPTILQWGERLGGRMAEFAVYSTALTGTQIANHYAAGDRTSWASMKAGSWLGALLSSAGWPARMTDLDTGVSTLSPVDLTSASVLDLAQSAATADGGILFVAADGQITYRSRRAYGMNTAMSTPQVTFTDQRANVTTAAVHGYMPGRFTYNLNPALLRNYYRTEPYSDAIEAADAYDTTSIANQGYHRGSAKIRATRQSDLIGHAGTQVADYKDPIVTFEALTVAPDDRPSSIRATGWQTLLDLELGHEVTVIRTPRTGAGISRTSRVELIEHEITPTLWVASIKVAGRATSETVWKLGTGALGSSTPLEW